MERRTSRRSGSASFKKADSLLSGITETGRFALLLELGYTFVVPRVFRESSSMRRATITTRREACRKRPLDEGLGRTLELPQFISAGFLKLLQVEVLCPRNHTHTAVLRRRVVHG